MISAIAEILKARIGELPWVERYGGLVVPATKPAFKTNQTTGASELSTPQVYAIGCDVNNERCWETGTYKYLHPSDDMASIAFFMDNGGCSVKSVSGPKSAFITYTFDVRFLCWMNVKKLGFDDCNLSALAVPDIIGKLMGRQNAGDGSAYADIYRNINVTGVRQLVKSPTMFQPFYFATEGAKRGIFLFPYDYFGLSITGTFDINKNCIPPLVAEDFSFPNSTTVICKEP